MFAFLTALSLLITKLLHRENNSLLIHYSSRNFIIVNKHPDLPINSNDATRETVQTLLRRKHPELASDKLYHEFYFVHRLDFATSGLLCIPLHKKACREASRAFAERRASKYYIALVRGFVADELLDVNCAIGDDAQNAHKMCITRNLSRARESRTIILALEYGLFQQYPCTKILVKPVTGRRHQIRVHCSYLGHTIVGDYTYSNKKDSETSRMFLHSLRLVLPTDSEHLDLLTADPFVPQLVSDWLPVKSVHKLSDQVFQKLDCDIIL